jgi:hypothetical protein
MAEQEMQNQSMVQRPPMGDDGGQMPMEEQNTDQSNENITQQLQEKAMALPPEQKQVIVQSLTPEFREILNIVFGSEINILIDVLESAIGEEPNPNPEPPMMASGGEGMINRPPVQPSGEQEGLVPRPQPPMA